MYSSHGGMGRNTDNETATNGKIFHSIGHSIPAPTGEAWRDLERDFITPVAA